MSTSAFEPTVRRRTLGCVLCAGGCAAASAVYQTFGHGVTSRAMTWAFLVPLLSGAVHLWAWGIARGRSVSPALARPWQNLLFAGLATVTAGLYYRGIVGIAGVDGGWEYWFLAGGGVLTLAGTLGLWRIKPEGSC